MSTMRAALFHENGGPEVIRVEDLSVSQVFVTLSGAARGEAD